MCCVIDLQLHGELHKATWCIISVVQMRRQCIGVPLHAQTYLSLNANPYTAVAYRSAMNI